MWMYPAAYVLGIVLFLVLSGLWKCIQDEEKRE